MLRKSNIDSDPNSIYGASKKLATIAVKNMKNPSDNPDMMLGLNQLPSSTISAQQPTNIMSMSMSNNVPMSNNMPTNVSKVKQSNNVSFFPQQSNRTILNKYSSEVDTFLTLISDANSNLQNLDLLLDSHYQPGQRKEIVNRKKNQLGMSAEDERSQRLRNDFKKTDAEMEQYIMKLLIDNRWDFNRDNDFVHFVISPKKSHKI